MDIDFVRQTVEQAGLASAGVGFLAGLLFSLNPVAIAAIPVSLAYVTRARGRRTAILFGSMFMVGLAVTHVLLGLAAGFGGWWVDKLMGRYWGIILGPVLILLGMVWPRWIKLTLPAASFRARRVSGMWGRFALGVPFSVAICPACTPALIVLLGVVVGIGSPVLGAIVLLAFAVARSIPIAIGVWAVGWLENLRPLARCQHTFEILGGVALMATGLYMLNAFFIIVPSLAG